MAQWNHYIERGNSQYSHGMYGKAILLFRQAPEQAQGDFDQLSEPSLEHAVGHADTLWAEFLKGFRYSIPGECPGEYQRFLE